MVITGLLPQRMDLHALHRLGTEWGVSVESLVYRCREVGAVSEPAYHRAFQRLNQLRNTQLFTLEPVENYAGEIPKLLRSAFDLAQTHGLTIEGLATELAMKAGRIRELLGAEDRRPRLQLV